jgi:hypothetical protein
MKRALLCAAMLLGASPAYAMELKGLEPGMTKSQVDAKHAILRCAVRSSPEVESTCDFTTTSTYESSELDNLAGHRVKEWKLQFFDEKLERITAIMYEDVSDDLVAALSTKYGKAKHDTRQMQNAYGAKFLEKAWVWSDKRDTMIALQPAGPTPRSTVLMLVSKAAADRSSERDRKASQQRAKDL